MDRPKLWMYLLALGLALLVGLMLVRIGLGGPEDIWLCTENGWKKHGQPSSPMPTSGCGTVTPTVEPVPMVIGGDKDEGGCLIGAGYSWCEALQQCVRPWETPCEVISPEATGSGEF